MQQKGEIGCCFSFFLRGEVKKDSFQKTNQMTFGSVAGKCWVFLLIVIQYDCTLDLETCFFGGSLVVLSIHAQPG